jgi:hypothetical protein
MLILPGITKAGGAHDSHGLLDRDSAKGYAEARGYQPLVLDLADSYAGPGARQVNASLKLIRQGPAIAALYGFSGGGYNLRHVIAKLRKDERSRIKLVVVIGAPNVSAKAFEGPWELVYRKDPKQGHMEGPKVLLAEYEASQPA